MKQIQLLLLRFASLNIHKFSEVKLTIVGIISKIKFEVVVVG